jgi:salicylate hydroxylase
LISNIDPIHQDAEAGVVTLENGKELRGDVIIGADGIKSQVRASLFGDNITAKPSGHSAYRGLIPGDKVLADPELAYLMGSTGLSIFLAKDRKLVIYSCRFQGKDYLNVVAVIPDQFLSEISLESWHEPGKVEDLIESFKGFHPTLLRLLSYMEECGLWQLRDQDPLSEWVKERAIVIGDAAHPMLPHLGQGGSQAIEDADMMAFCLAGMSSETSSKESVHAALQRVFSLRYERATLCQERSREQAFGKREVQLDSSAPVKALNPLQFAAYIFTYKGAKAWAEQQGEDTQGTPSPPPGKHQLDAKPSSLLSATAAS